MGTLPAGDTIEWVPTVVADPRDQPGTPGEVVLVWTDNVSGYTWRVISGAGGDASEECPGQPNQAGTCEGYPQPVSFQTYLWDEDTAAWLPAGGSGQTNGCGGGGGNN